MATAAHQLDYRLKAFLRRLPIDDIPNRPKVLRFPILILQTVSNAIISISLLAHSPIPKGKTPKAKKSMKTY